jgi:hypothetical protein
MVFKIRITRNGGGGFCVHAHAILMNQGILIWKATQLLLKCLKELLM